MSAPDLSEFMTLSKPRRPSCLVGRLLAGETDPKLPAAERKQLAAALETDKGIITPAAISAWLERRGIEITWQSVASHRRKGCGCGRR